MIGCVSIEYVPTAEALPAILAAVHDSDLPIHGLKAMPINQSQNVTLSLDVGFPSRSSLEMLGAKLSALEMVTRVLHLSRRDPRSC